MAEREHDEDLRDAWLDAALEEKLGGAASADLPARMTEQSERMAPARRGAGRLAAAAVVLLGLLVIVGVRLLRDAGEGSTEASDTLQDPVPTAPVAVLYVEESPRWEYRYLKNTLLRADGVRMQAFLFDAGPGFVQAHSDAMEPLATLPRTAEELAAYDVVLLGDVRPEHVGAAAGDTGAWVRALDAFVRAGGGLAFLSGERAIPYAWRETRLVDLLPTELEDDPSVVDVPDEGVAPRIDPAATNHAILRLADSPVTTAQVLCDVRFRSFVPLGPPRDGARVLLYGVGERPLLAVGGVAKGRAVVVATEDTWRLRDPHGDVYYDRLWTQIVRWLAKRER